MIARRQRQRPLTILDAISDPHLFGQHFQDQHTWLAWMAFLCALFALPMTPEQLAIYRQHTGRSTPPSEPLHEAWLVCGRRAGKSFILAVIAVFLATCRDWRAYLGPGEVGTIMLLARDRRQARVLKRYVRGLLHAVPMLRRLIQNEDSDGITLGNRVVIEIHTASFRSTRGYTVIAALCDEIAFWPSDETSSEPDVEVLAALRPGMATIPGASLLCASSPYARRGSLWDAHRRHYGKDGDPVLVWQAPTRDMNPSVPQRVIASAMEEDPARAAAEYMAQFRSDVEAFVSREIVMACVSTGVYERPPLSGTSYRAFLDFAGGSGSDSMTLAIGHKDGGTVVVDALRETRPPFSPEFAIAQFATLLKAYKIYRVEGDNFGGEFAREPLKKFAISYEVTKKAKSDLYAHHLLPMLNSGRVDLLDHPRSIQQIVSLECHTARAGRDKIDHAPGGHDDLSNAIAGLVARAPGGTYRWQGDWVSGPVKPPEDDAQKAERVRKLIAKLKAGEPV